MVSVAGFEPAYAEASLPKRVNNLVIPHTDYQITLKETQMTKQEIISMDDLQFKMYALSCTSKLELHNILNIPYNGKYSKIINAKFRHTNATLKLKDLKYDTITKLCPVCGESFTTQKDHPREKTTCSYACSNTHFRSGINHPNHQIAMSNNTTPSSNNYQTICFHYHKYECCVCGESRIVEVHHFDHDHNNVNPNNLIPLCPTCHQLYHSNYRNDVLPCILQFISSLK